MVACAGSTLVELLVVLGCVVLCVSNILAAL